MLAIIDANSKAYVDKDSLVVNIFLFTCQADILLIARVSAMQ